MRLLDTREQKSPRFLLDAFPDLTITQLEIGDYFSGDNYVLINGERKIVQNDEGFMILKKTADVQWQGLHGKLVEIKIGPDFGKHTEPIERFRDEAYRMSVYKQQNPNVQLHAVWVMNGPYDAKTLEIFYHICFKYHIWGHYCMFEKELIQFLKDLDQPSQYQEFAPFIKRSHEEPTILAKMLRQFPGISSEMAMKLAEALNCSWMEMFYPEYNDRVREDIQLEIINTIGRKKNGEPKKLANDLIYWIETGEKL